MKKIVYLLSIICLLTCGLIAGFLFSQDIRFFMQSQGMSSQPFVSDTNILQCDDTQYQNTIFALQQEIEQLKKTQNIPTTQTPEIQTGTGGKKLDDSKQIGEVLKNFPTYQFEEKPYDEYFLVFGITDEFPKKYITYKTQSFESYFFVESDYDELYNFFDAVSYDLPITLNKNNVFGERSFFINPKITDDYVRLVIQYQKHVFGLKIQKKYYNEIKQTLEKF